MMKSKTLYNNWIVQNKNLTTENKSNKKFFKEAITQSYHKLTNELTYSRLNVNILLDEVNSECSILGYGTSYWRTTDFTTIIYGNLKYLVKIMTDQETKEFTVVKYTVNKVSDDIYELENEYAKSVMIVK